MIKKLTFESEIVEIRKLISNRKAEWRLSTLDWEDVEQMLLTRVWQKFHTYDPTKGKLDCWVNRLISNFIKNLLRDNLTKFSRPCTLGCVFNLGNGACSFTKSKIQCAECPMYANWQKKKESQFNIKASLPLENHSQEVNNQPGDFLDIDYAKKVIDQKIKEKLTDREKKIYTMLYVDFMTAQQVSEKLKYKDKMYATESYAKILEFQKKIIKLSTQVIREEDLA